MTFMRIPSCVYGGGGRGAGASPHVCVGGGACVGREAIANMPTYMVQNDTSRYPAQMVCYFNALLQVLLVLPGVWQAVMHRHPNGAVDAHDNEACPACLLERVACDVRQPENRGYTVMSCCMLYGMLHVAWLFCVCMFMQLGALWCVFVSNTP